MAFLPFLLNRSRLPICSYKFFLFWPVPLSSPHQLKKEKKKKLCIYINKKKKKKKKKKKYLCMYIDKQNQFKKKKYYFFLFWPVTLQTLNGSSTVFVTTYKAYTMTFMHFLLNRSKWACNTSNT